MDAVVNNDHKAIRRLEEAVKRVHKRFRVDGDEVQFIPAKLGLKKLVEECQQLSHRSPEQGVSIPSTLDQTISSGLSETLVKEVRAAYDVREGKRGPKPKAPKVPVIKASFKALAAEVSKGFEHFRNRRKKKTKPEV